MDRRLGMKITTWVSTNATRIPMLCGKRLPLMVYTCGAFDKKSGGSHQRDAAATKHGNKESPHTIRESPTELKISLVLTN